MRARVGAAEFHRRTGHVPEAFHVGPKVLWLRRHEPERLPADRLLPAAARCRAAPADRRGRHRRDARQRHAVLRPAGQALGRTSCSRTFGVDPALFPEVLPSWQVAAGLPRQRRGRGCRCEPGMPVVIGAADSQCAAYGGRDHRAGRDQRDGRRVVLPELGGRTSRSTTCGSRTTATSCPDRLLHRARRQHDRRGARLGSSPPRLRRPRGRWPPTRRGSRDGWRGSTRSTRRRCSCLTSATGSATTHRSGRVRRARGPA